MSRSGRSCAETAVGKAAGERETAERLGIAAAYREGLSLHAIAAVGGPGGIKLCTIGPGAEKADDAILARWWCRSAGDAERLAATAMARAKRRSGRQNAFVAAELIERTARDLNIAIRSDPELTEEAMNVAARIDGEIERMRQSGELRSVNTAYRNYRIEATSRGEKFLRYRDWMSKYRDKLLRETAATLKYL